MDAVLQAIAEPTRRTIVEMVARAGEMSASEIGERFDMTPPAVSQHLKVLREAQVLAVEKRAQRRIYTINPRAMHELEGWAKHVAQLWSRRLDRLERVLAEERKGRARRR